MSVIESSKKSRNRSVLPLNVDKPTHKKVKNYALDRGMTIQAAATRLLERALIGAIRPTPVAAVDEKI